MPSNKTTEIPGELHQVLKLLALKQGITLKELVRSALIAYIEYQQRIIKKREKDFDEIQNRFHSKVQEIPPEELEKEIAEAIAEVRDSKRKNCA